jgi:hypothetical protein
MTRVAPRFAEFARLLAIRLNPPWTGAAVLVIEPLATTGTCRDLFRTVLADRDLHDRVFGDLAGEYLAGLSGSKGADEARKILASAATGVGKSSSPMLRLWSALDSSLREVPVSNDDMPVISSEDMASELKVIDPNVSFISLDRMHTLWSRRWIDEEFRSYVASRMKIENLRYEPERHDCDDFAARLQIYATDAILQASGRGATHSLFRCQVEIPAGKELLGIRDGHHACNLARCADGTWILIEPQMAPHVDRTWSRLLIDALKDGSCRLVKIGS